MRNQLLIPIAAFAFLLGTISVGAISAQSEETSPPSIIENLIERFNLNEDEVQTVIDQTRDEHQAAWQARYEAWLDEEVAGGNLTEEQKQLILDKSAQLQAEMEQKRAELQTWSEENGIDLRYLHGAKFHGGFHRIHGGPAWMMR